MTTLLLIRHARHDLLGKVLTGRAPGIHLNSEGKAEANALLERLRAISISAIYSSPLERAWETAGPLAAGRALDVRSSHGFNEIDFGDWTSLPFAELDQRQEWKLWNEARHRAAPPGGETMGAVLERAGEEMGNIARCHPGGVVAIFSHGDVIKGAIMDCMGISVEHHMRFEVAPVSISVIKVRDGSREVVAMNELGAPRWDL